MEGYMRARFCRRMAQRHSVLMPCTHAQHREQHVWVALAFATAGFHQFHGSGHDAEEQWQRQRTADAAGGA